MGSPVSVVVAVIVMQLRNEPSLLTNEHYHSGYVMLTIPLQPYTKTKLTIFTNTSTDKTPTYSLYYFISFAIKKTKRRMRKGS